MSYQLDDKAMRWRKLITFPQLVMATNQVLEIISPIPLVGLEPTFSLSGESYQLDDKGAKCFFFTDINHEATTRRMLQASTRCWKLTCKTHFVNL